MSLKNADLFLAIWNAIGLVARVARSGVRWILRRERKPLFRATAAALGSFLVRVPAALAGRHAARAR